MNKCMRMIATGFAVASVLWTQAGSAQVNPTASIYQGFMTGARYKALTDIARNYYVVGLLDGLYVAPFFEGSASSMNNLARCLGGLTDAQALGIVDQYVAANLAQLDKPMNVIVLVAISDVCKSKGVPLQ